MEIKLLNKNFKGILINIYPRSISIYFHFPNTTYEISWKRRSTIDFNKQLYLERASELLLKLNITEIRIQ